MVSDGYNNGIVFCIVSEGVSRNHYHINLNFIGIQAEAYTDAHTLRKGKVSNNSLHIIE